MIPERIMHDYQVSIYRERPKSRKFVLPTCIMLIILASFMFGYESTTSEEIEMNYAKDLRRMERSSNTSKCEEGISNSGFAQCKDFCSTLQSRLKAAKKKKTSTWRTVNYCLIGLLCILIPTSIIVFIIQCWKLKSKQAAKQPETPIIVVQPQDKPKKDASIPPEATKKNTDLAGDKPNLPEVSPPIISPPDAISPEISPPKVGIRVQKQTKGPKYTAADYVKLRDHVKKTTAQHKSDTRSSKFTKMGPISIPREPEIPPAAADLPNNIILDRVTYDPKLNEKWDIGSDVDDIELEPSSTADSVNSARSGRTKTSTLGAEDRIADKEEEERFNKVNGKIENVVKPEEKMPLENAEKMEEAEDKTQSISTKKKPFKTPEGKSKKSKRSKEKSAKKEPKDKK